jgi:hypothetical protein
MANWPTGPASPDGHRLPRLDLRVLRRHVPGRKDVGEKQDLLVAQPGGNPHRTDVGERHPQVLGLAAGKPSEEVGVAEEAGGRLTHDLAGRVGIRIGDVAEGEHLLPAEEAGATGDGEGDDHPITAAERLDVASDLDDFPHGLVADDVALLHGRHQAAVDMQVGSADRRGADLHDNVTRVPDLRIRHRVDSDVFLAVPAQRAHEWLLAAGQIARARPITMAKRRRRDAGEIPR